MKKRILAILLCTVLCVFLLPCTISADGAPLNFVVIDDALPQELINSTVYYGSSVYIPSWMLKEYNLGLQYHYFVSSTTACLESSDKMLCFNVSTGKTTDLDDYSYSISAIVQNGTVYLPLSFICSYFCTFSYANIGGNEYGSVLRIYTGNYVLTDEEFLKAAKPAMQRHYETYYREKDNKDITEAPPAGGQEKTHAGDTVRLGLVGLPDPATLDQLKQMNMNACFFLRPDEIRSDPDLVRQMACRGFGLGLDCGTGTAEDYAEAAALLWETTRVRSVLVSLQPGTEMIPGTVCHYRTEFGDTESDRMSGTYAVTAALDAGTGDTTLLFPCGAEQKTALNVLVYFLRDQQFTVTALRETDEN